MWLFLLKCIYFLLPAGLANMAPVLMKFWFKGLAQPIDGGQTWQGQPLFGRSKTWRGLIFATLFGIIIFGLQQYLYRFQGIKDISLFNYNQYNLWLGFLMGLGAILGDLAKSFFKRRLKMAPGHVWIPLDQIDYSIGALLLSALIYWPGWSVTITCILIGFILHLLINLIGYAIKLKKNKL